MPPPPKTATAYAFWNLNRAPLLRSVQSPEWSWGGALLPSLLPQARRCCCSLRSGRVRTACRNTQIPAASTGRIPPSPARGLVVPKWIRHIPAHGAHGLRRRAGRVTCLAGRRTFRRTRRRRRSASGTTLQPPSVPLPRAEVCVAVPSSRICYAKNTGSRLPAP